MICLNHDITFCEEYNFVHEILWKRQRVCYNVLCKNIMKMIVNKQYYNKKQNFEMIYVATA